MKQMDALALVRFPHPGHHPGKGLPHRLSLLRGFHGPHMKCRGDIRTGGDHQAAQHPGQPVKGHGFRMDNAGPANILGKQTGAFFMNNNVIV